MNSGNTHLAILFNNSDNQSDCIRTVGYTSSTTVSLGEGVGVDTNRGVCRQGNGNVLLCIFAACFTSGIRNAGNGRNGSVGGSHTVSCISNIGTSQGRESKSLSRAGGTSIGQLVLLGQSNSGHIGVSGFFAFSGESNGAHAQDKNQSQSERKNFLHVDNLPILFIDCM